MSVVLIGCAYRSLQISEIVEAVKYPDDIDAVVQRLLHEVVDHIIRIVIVAEYVLSSEEHLQLRILEACSELSEPLPRILVQKSHARVKCRTAPALYRVVADLIHLVDDREHLLRGHPRRDQGLMRVSEDRFHYLNGFFLHHFLLV